MLTIDNQITKEIKQLREIVKEDRVAAKVFAQANKDHLTYKRVILDIGEDSVKITSHERLVGVSNTGKIYDRQGQKGAMQGFIVNKNKAYKISGGTVHLASLATLASIMKSTNIHYESFTSAMRVINPALFDIAEQASVIWDVPESVLWLTKTSSHFIVKNKYTNHNKLMRDRLGLLSKRDCAKLMRAAGACNLLFMYKEIIEHPELCPINITTTLTDLLRLSKLFDKKVNLAWSERRILEEHDKLAKLQLDYLKKSMLASPVPLKVASHFDELAQYTGWELIADTGRLALEAMVKKHCVVGYRHQIESGRCGIFNIKGYTAEIDNSWKCVQLRGYRNSEASEELREEVAKALKAFSKTKEAKMVHESIQHEDVWEMDLNF